MGGDQRRGRVRESDRPADVRAASSLGLLLLLQVDLCCVAAIGGGRGGSKPPYKNGPVEIYFTCLRN